MSIWSRIRRAFAPSDDYWYYPIGTPTTSGVRVSEKSALKYLTVFSCVSLIAGDVARLPLNLYQRRKDGGKDLLTDHPLADLLHNAPNRETTSFNFRETLQGHLLLQGNCFSYIERKKDDSIAALWQFPDPGAVKIDRVGKELAYTYKTADGKEVTRTRHNVFHIPGYGYNGISGMSMISIANEAIGLGLAAETFGSKYFGDGTHPTGVIEMDRSLGDNRTDYVKELKKGFAGLGKSHKMMLLENGMKYKPLTVPLNDAQFLETRQFQKTEICGMYHVPPHKIGIHGQNSNYNNLEQENASYVDSCLMHWLVRWESAFSQQLLKEKERRAGLFFEFQVQGLLRGDSAARADYYNKIFQVGGISPNEIRSKENMNPDPADGADKKYVMLNMIPVDQAGDLQSVQPDKEVVKAFFKNPEIENRSILVRDRIAKRYSPLILDAATAIVNRETKAIKTKINNRSATDVDKFLTEFYRSFPEYINKKMGPVLRSYMLAVIDAGAAEMNVDPGNLDTEIRAYIDRYAERHVDSSLGQMRSLIDDGPDAIEERADDWQEKRPGQIESNETTRASGAAFSFVAFGAGLSLAWRIRGPKTCPYCKTLNGNKIRSGGSFAESGIEIDPEGGTGPMKINGKKMHPPLHRGCDCYISAG